MPKSRCKFYVDSVTKRAGGIENIVLRALYDPNIPEDQLFAKASPSGELTFTLANKNLLGEFEPGDAYYIDLTPADK